MPNPESLALYRHLLRAVRTAPALPAPVQRKLVWNVRQLFDFYRGAGVSATHDLLEDGRACLRLLHWLRTLPQVCGPQGSIRSGGPPAGAPPAAPRTRRQPPVPPLSLPPCPRPCGSLPAGANAWPP